MVETGARVAGDGCCCGVGSTSTLKGVSSTGGTAGSIGGNGNAALLSTTGGGGGFSEGGGAGCLTFAVGIVVTAG